MALYFLSPDGYLAIDRRATPRYDVTLAVEAAVTANGDPVVGMTKDVSESGMQLLLPTDVAEGTVIGFTCPHFAGSARVVWNRPEGSYVRMGVRFTSLSSGSRDRLLDLIADLKKQQLTRFMTAQA